MSEKQHMLAKKLLPIVYKAKMKSQHLTYGTAARELGKTPGKYSRATAQTCDLLDAAAAIGKVPLLALSTVLTSDGEFNPKAWSTGELAEFRDAIINKSMNHKFTDDDLAAIYRGLNKLSGMGNKKAWSHVLNTVPRLELISTIAIPEIAEDAINDLGTNFPETRLSVNRSYSRDNSVREAVLKRARGRCEYCGELGFLKTNGERFLETHHIIALADQGADRRSNVIALCPNHHREAHFGKDQRLLEDKLMKIVAGKET